MKAIRINAWEHGPSGVYLKPEAMGLLPAPCPCAFTNYKLTGKDGGACVVDVFKGSPGVAFVPVDAPEWADGAIERIFDDSGAKRPGYWAEDGEDL